MEYRNAKYIDEFRIECEINHPVLGWIPYGLDPDDLDMTIDNNALLAAMAKTQDVIPYTPPTQAELDAAKASELRLQRDKLLQTLVDPLAGNALRWAELSASKQQAWTEYRKALLNIPQQVGFPNSVIWPTQP